MHGTHRLSSASIPLLYYSHALCGLNRVRLPRIDCWRPFGELVGYFGPDALRGRRHCSKVPTRPTENPTMDRRSFVAHLAGALAVAPLAARASPAAAASVDTVAPAPPVQGNVSALGALAASMPVGSWAELPSEGINSVVARPGSSGSMCAATANATTTQN